MALLKDSNPELLWAVLLTRYDVSEASGHSSLRYVLMLLLAMFCQGES